MRFFLLVLLISLTMVAASQDEPALRLNQIQVIASHNSYKKLPNANVFRFLMKYREKLGKDLDPQDIDYQHLPFDSQFNNYGVRGLELDIYNDPKGGAFYKRKINAFVRGVRQSSGIPELKKPGFKMLHIKDVDYETNYYTFKDGLKAIKAWSDAHPNHLPIFINVETKAESPGDANGFLRFVGFKRSIKFDEKACDSMDAEIRSVFGENLHQVITPDKVRGNYPTLNDMVLANAWPLLNNCRGKVVFIMQGDAENIYTKGHERLNGRAMFVYAYEVNPNAAFVIQNDAKGDKEKIKTLVKKGYIVRTRADSGTHEARNNDITCRESAFEGGAQIISTDYYKADSRLGIYCVVLPEGRAGRVNPVNTPGDSRLLNE